MTRVMGRVVVVFVPEEESLTKIGFKIEVENKVITLIEEQNKENSKIYRDDFVFVNIEKDNITNEIACYIEPISNIDSGSDDDE